MSTTRSTFELHLSGKEGKPRFETICVSRGELIGTVRRLIEDRNLRWVDVCELGIPLFTIGR